MSNTNTATKIPTPKKGVVAFFDFEKGKIAVKPRTGRTRHTDSLALKNVEFQVVEGDRYGCVPTGNLGYIHGNIASTSDLTNPTTIKWDGHAFVDGKGTTVENPKTLLIVGKTIIGFYPS